MSFGGSPSPTSMNTPSKPRQIFVNLSVRDLERSKAFFSRLGFTFNPQFSDDKGACMIINDHAYVMLLTEPFFRGFTKRTPCDTSTHTEGLFALSCPSRDAVNAMVDTAIAAGGSHAMDPMDHDFMYGWSFYDPDGHHWEVVWMDESASQNPSA